MLASEAKSSNLMTFYEGKKSMSMITGAEPAIGTLDGLNDFTAHFSRHLKHTFKAHIVCTFKGGKWILAIRLCLLH